MNRLAICAIVRDEAPHIIEWMAFHRLVGVSRFVLYDDRSTDGTPEIAEKYTDVVVHRYTEGWHSAPYFGLNQGTGVYWWDKPQACSFHHFAEHHGEETYWAAFIDVDEFLFHTTVDSLPDFLVPFEQHAGVVANWLVFGSNGHRTRPAGLTVEAYTRRGETGTPVPYGKHVKTIVNMTRQHRWGLNGSHCPVFADGSAPVTQDGHPNPWSMTPSPTSDGLRINHYYHRSYEEAALKAVKFDSNAPPGYPNATRVAAHDCNEVHDVEILRFLPRLKEALQCA